MNDWDHQRQCTINGIIEISSEEASYNRSFRLFGTLAAMCINMKGHVNASATEVYNNIMNNPSKYPKLKDAAIHSM